MRAPLPVTSLALLTLACGARSSLDDSDSVGAGGSNPSTTSSSTAGGAGGNGGEGGGELVCPELRWAGDPVRVPVVFGGEVSGLRLLRVGATRWALAFEGRDSAGRLVASLAIESPFATWPPTVGAPDANFPASLPFAVGAGETGRFAFAASDPVGNHVLGQAEPGQNGSSFVDWPGGQPAPMRFVTRSPSGAYAIGRGAGETGLFVDLVSGFSPSPTVTSLGMLGCASTMLAEAVPSQSGGFLVASTPDQPFDDCLDPDLPGPPTAVQIHHVRGTNLEQRSAFVSAAAVRELRLAEAPGGAWLGIGREGTGVFDVHPVDTDGNASDVLLSFVDDPSRLNHHGVAAIEREVAIAIVRPSAFDGLPTLEVLVRQGFLGFGGVSSQGLPLQPVGAPAVATQPGRASVLVAVVDDSQPQATIALLRADCVLAGER